MSLPSLCRALLLTTLATSALVACTTGASGDADEDDDFASSESAVISTTERALVGSYRRSDPTSIVRGLYTKHPTKNYAFEKEVMFVLEVDPALVPGLCPPSMPGAICDGERIEGELRATTRTLELRASDPARVAPQAKHLLGKWRYTLGASTLSLVKVGAPATTLVLDKGSYCSQVYDCNAQRPDDTCSTEMECNAQHACVVKRADPTCDPSWRSVQDLGDVGGTWTAAGAPASAYAKLELTPAAAPRGTSSAGTFRGTKGAVVTLGQFSTMPENPAIGFASLSLVPQGSAPGAMPDAFIVQGVHLSPTGKVVEMKVTPLGNLGPTGPSWVYSRQP